MWIYSSSDQLDHSLQIFQRCFGCFDHVICFHGEAAAVSTSLSSRSKGRKFKSSQTRQTCSESRQTGFIFFRRGVSNESDHRCPITTLVRLIIKIMIVIIKNCVWTINARTVVCVVFGVTTSSRVTSRRRHTLTTSKSWNNFLPATKTTSKRWYFVPVFLVCFLVFPLSQDVEAASTATSHNAPTTERSQRTTYTSHSLALSLWALSLSHSLSPPPRRQRRRRRCPSFVFSTRKLFSFLALGLGPGQGKGADKERETERWYGGRKKNRHGRYWAKTSFEFEWQRKK